MRVVWKFPLPETHGTVDVPKGAKPLSFGVHGRDFTLWCLCDSDPGVPKQPLRYYISGTGWDIQDRDLDGLQFLTTTFNGPFVFHLWVEDQP